MKKNDPDFLEAKLRYFVGVSLTLILGGSIFIILYSLVFVTQPLGESSENDRALFSILTPILEQGSSSGKRSFFSQKFFWFTDGIVPPFDVFHRVGGGDTNE